MVLPELQKLGKRKLIMDLYLYLKHCAKTGKNKTMIIDLYLMDSL